MTTPIQEAVFATLGQFAGLNASVATRIYPDEAPQQVARPYVVWQEISLVQAADLLGSAETGGLNNYRVQVTVWAEKASQVRALDLQVRLAMQAASLFKSLVADARSLGRDTETKLYGMQSDFSVWLKT